MPFQVVHAQNRLAQGRTQRTSHTGPHQQGPRQARPTGEGHHIHVLQRLARCLQHLLGQRQHATNMVAAGQLRHHATIGLVHLDLAVKRMRQQHRQVRPTDPYQRHPGFVTRGLNTQHTVVFCHSGEV